MLFRSVDQYVNQINNLHLRSVEIVEFNNSACSLRVDARGECYGALGFRIMVFA